MADLATELVNAGVARTTAHPSRKEDDSDPAPPSPLPYISGQTLRRITDPLPVPEQCPFCGGLPKYVNHADIYGGREYGSWPYALACASCDAYVGLHPYTHIPLGTLANKDLREARKRGKSAFIRLVDQRGWLRSEGYEWLARRLDIAIETCHWGWFDLETCGQAELICRKGEMK